MVYWQGGTIHYRQSTDSGVTWSDAVPLTSGGTALYPCSLERTGSALHLIWPDGRNAGKWEVYYKRSTDGGNSWGHETRLTSGVDLFRMGTAASGEALHVVWANKSLLEKVPAGDATWTWTWGEIYYQRSTDGGVTWEKEVRLTQPESSAMRPAVAVSGRYVHVCWFDRRDSEKKPAWDWKSYYTTSPDGGLTWQPAERLAERQHGAWEAAAVAGTETSAVELLAQSEVLYFLTRPATAAGPAHSQSHHTTDEPPTTPPVPHRPLPDR